MPYWIFTSSEDWTVPEGVFAVDALIVGGGGASGGSVSGGAFGQGGGGGAGGVVLVSDILVTPGEIIPVTVGAGGAYALTLAFPKATPGGSSSFKGHSAVGGGVGQYQDSAVSNNVLYPENAGGAGASGGGGCGGGLTALTDIRGGGAAVLGQGNPGGGSAQSDSNAENAKPGGGGGGAAQAGESVGETALRGGKGGDGYALSEIDWWDQELANLLNPTVNGDVDLTGHLSTPEWQPNTPYTAGDVVWESFSWRLYVCHTTTAGSASFTGSPGFHRLFYGVGGGGGGGNNGESGNQATPGKGGGAEGSFVVSGGTGFLWPAQPNTGGGGPGGGGGGSNQLGGAAGIVILRAATISALDCSNVGVDQIVYDLALRAGIPASRIDVSQLAPTSDFPYVWGMGVGRPASARQLIELLQAYSFFDVTEQGGIIRATRRDRDPDDTIGLDDLRAHAYGEEQPSLAERERTEDYEIPRETRVQYLQALAEYEPGVEAYARRVTDAEGVVDIDLSAIAMEPDRAAVIAEATMLEAITAREAITFHLTGTEANKALRAGDIKTLSVNGRTDVVRLVEINYAFPGLLRVASRRHDPTVYASDAQGVGRRAIGSIIINPGPTDLALLDAPLVREHDEAPGYFAAMGGNPTIPGIMEGWPGGDLERLESTGWESIARALRPGCQVGATTTTLADADFAVIDPQELRVTVPGFLLPATLQEACLGANLAAVEVLGASPGWELIRFLDAEYDAALGEWRLTNLIRGVHGTEWATGLHTLGNRFVFLGGEVQVITDIDTELDLSRLHNAATIGSVSTASLEQSFAWTGVDRKPYAPVHVHGTRETDDDILLDWTRRDRVGMELQSGQTLPLSEDAEAYEVDIIGTDSDGEFVLRKLEVTSPEATYTAAQQTTDFGSLPGTLTVAVYQLGALGRGYPATVTLTID